MLPNINYYSGNSTATKPSFLSTTYSKIKLDEKNLNNNE